MNITLPLPDNQKLVVTYRIEAGCLGPTGANHVEQFCELVRKGMAKVDADFIQWNIVPRYNKQLHEMSYAIGGKELSHDMAEKYLLLFKKELDEFECHLQENLANMIDMYLRRINQG